MELDGYCEELKIAFEYDGEFHYKDIYDDYHNQQKRDTIKDKLCKEQGIKLIRIPYWINDKRTYIQDQLSSES